MVNDFQVFPASVDLRRVVVLFVAIFVCGKSFAAEPEDGSVEANALGSASFASGSLHNTLADAIEPYGGGLETIEPVAIVAPQHSEEQWLFPEHPLTGEASPEFLQAALLQPTPLIRPRTSVLPSLDSPATSTQPAVGRVALNNSSGSGATLGTQNLLGFGRRDVVLGTESFPKATTDLGDLLRKSSSAMSVDVQSRTPVVHDPRIRSSRVGALAASGSYWVPARADLDTVLSKFDSRLIESTTIVPGPYASRYGPGFQYVDIELLGSPRYSGGHQTHGSTAFDFKNNGNQWLGLQSIDTGNETWGARFNYAHRTGDDYRAGNGQRIWSGYESREMTLALGTDLGDDQSLEFRMLRLDQTDVDFPGYVFDIDFLVTDGYELTHVIDEGSWFDGLETSVWYNRTRFEGNAQNPDQQELFPLLNLIGYTGFTDVDSMSTGYRQMVNWGGQQDGFTFTLGHDLRLIKQELNEISSGFTLGLPIPFTDRNSPIPDSYSVNPGLFMEFEQTSADLVFTSGARFDYVNTDIVEDQAKLADIGLDAVPATYAEIVGTEQYDQDFQHFSLFAALQHNVTEELTRTISIGYAERPPNLTELYAAQPFLMVLQNGLNNVTGDPTLRDEKLLQIDVAWNFESSPIKCGVRGFHAWAFDYITFENTRVAYIPPNGDVGQVSLRYVNTSLATLAGGEAFAELAPESFLSPYAIVKYVDGRDRSRNGDFATSNGSAGNPSQKVAGASRGAFSGIFGADSEPLPGISPLEARLGLRLKNTGDEKLWTIELESRIVAAQERVATSLLETPTPGFTLWNIRGLFQMTENLTLATGIENFTNKLYREHLDFRNQSGQSIYQPGFNFYVGARLDY